MTYLGIDNGNTGGVAALSELPGLSPFGMFKMPVVSYVRKGNPDSKKAAARKDKGYVEIDTVRFIERLRKIDEPHKIVAIFEECPDHADMASVMRSMAMSAGRILAALEILKIRVVRIQSRDWHPVILGKVPKGQTKEAALKIAGEIWPKERWLASDKSKVPHTGIVDAVLIAEYGRRLRL